MPITTEVLCKLSVNTGPGNSTAQPNPNDSIGGFMSSTQLVQGAMNNLFDNISGDENVIMKVEYRCVFFHNSHATLPLTAPKIWISGPRCSVSAATDVFTLLSNEIMTAHGHPDGAAVRLEAEKPGDTMPGGVNNTTTYFVRDVTATTFKLAATKGGTAINITTDGQVAVRPYAGALKEIAMDGTGIVSATLATAQAERIADEGTAPSGEVFSAPVTKSAGLSLATLGVAQCVGAWVKRTAQNTGALDYDRVVVRIEGDSAE